MKVVVNRCYGGFSLSYEAVMEYAKRKGIKIYAFKNATNKDGEIDFDKELEAAGTEVLLRDWPV